MANWLLSHKKKNWLSLFVFGTIVLTYWSKTSQVSALKSRGLYADGSGTGRPTNYESVPGTLPEVQVYHNHYGSQYLQVSLSTRQKKFVLKGCPAETLHYTGTCLEYQSAFPFVRIGSPRPLCRKQVCPPQKKPKGGANSYD
jgi:hypothetical protein